jgi:hypothetical protein
MQTVLVTGNTFPVKDQIKAMGGRWDGDAKGWKVPADKADAAKALVASAPVVPRTGGNGGQSSYRPSRCKECGCAASRYNKIYRNGVCKDCYVSNREEAEMGY